jgi:thioredoxin-dependent peroxiredoxin
MAIRLGDEAPNFTAETTQGTVNFHEWLGDGWAYSFHIRRISPPCAPRNWEPWRT